MYPLLIPLRGYPPSLADKRTPRSPQAPRPEGDGEYSQPAVLGFFGAPLCASAARRSSRRLAKQPERKETGTTPAARPLTTRCLRSLLVARTAWLVSGLRVVLRCHPRNVPNNPFLRAFLSSVIFLIFELDTPIDGFIYVSSEPLRNALRHIDASWSVKRRAAPGFSLSLCSESRKA
jgi:hypothetical protein